MPATLDLSSRYFYLNMNQFSSCCMNLGFVRDSFNIVVLWLQDPIATYIEDCRYTVRSTLKIVKKDLC